MGNLFADILKVIFEPFAVGALLGIVALVLFKRKKCTPWVTALLLAGTFMLSGRLICHPILRSSRYSLILIFPALIFVSWFCLKFGVLFRKYFPEKWGGKWRNLLARLLPGLGVIGLICACIGQLLHFDPQREWFVNTVQTYLKHAQPNDILYVQYENKRIAFYARKKLDDLKVVTKAIVPVEYLTEQLHGVKNIPGKHYFFFFLKKGQQEPEAANLKLAPGDGTWKILARHFTSRKKNKEFVLAVFEAGCPNIEEWNNMLPPEPGNDLYHHLGGFETPLSAQQQRVAEERFKKWGLLAYSDLSKRLLPSGIWLGLSEANKTYPPDIRLCSRNALAGKYSLYVDSLVSGGSTGFNLPYIKQKFRYCFFVRGEGEKTSQLTATTLLVDLKSGSSKAIERLEFYIQPGKVYRIFGTVADDLGRQQRFCPALGVYGRLTIDQFSVVPLEKR